VEEGGKKSSERGERGRETLWGGMVRGEKGGVKDGLTKWENDQMTKCLKG